MSANPKRGPYQSAQERIAETAEADSGPRAIPRKVTFNRTRARKLAKCLGVGAGHAAPPLFASVMSRRTKETFFGALNRTAQTYRHDREFHSAQNFPAAVAQLKELLKPLAALLDAGPAYSLWRALAAVDPSIDRATLARFVRAVEAALPQARKRAMAAKPDFPALAALACALMRLYEAHSGGRYLDWNRQPGPAGPQEPRSHRFVRKVLRMIEPKASALLVKRAMAAGFGQLIELRARNLI